MHWAQLHGLIVICLFFCQCNNVGESTSRPGKATKPAEATKAGGLAALLPGHLSGMWGSFCSHFSLPTKFLLPQINPIHYFYLPPLSYLISCNTDPILNHNTSWRSITRDNGVSAQNPRISACSTLRKSPPSRGQPISLRRRSSTRPHEQLRCIA